MTNHTPEHLKKENREKYITPKTTDMSWINTPDYAERLAVVSDQITTTSYQAGVKDVAMIVIGWREKDWPEKFDRYTAQLIADDLEKRLSTLLDNPK